MPDKHLIEAEVVAQGGQDRDVVGEAQGTKRTVIVVRTDGHVIGEVAGRRGASTVTDEEDPRPSAPSVKEGGDEGAYLLPVDPGEDVSEMRQIIVGETYRVRRGDTGEARLRCRYG